jgi:hypothetical protein
MNLFGVAEEVMRSSDPLFRAGYIRPAAGVRHWRSSMPIPTGRIAPCSASIFTAITARALEPGPDRMDQRGHKMLESCGRLDAPQFLDAGKAGALVNDGSRLTDAVAAG